MKLPRLGPKERIYLQSIACGNDFELVWGRYEWLDEIEINGEWTTDIDRRVLKQLAAKGLIEFSARAQFTTLRPRPHLTELGMSVYQTLTERVPSEVEQ